MTIAGSDPSAGAGIQADIKTFAAMGVYGVSVITALTAQNSLKVKDVLAVQPDFVTTQLETLFEDIPIAAAKTGMLYDMGVILAVAKFMGNRQDVKLVVDPVMVSSTGGALLKAGAAKALVMDLFPLAHLVTPNITEASTLVNIKIHDESSMEEAAVKIARLGPANVLVKGGHLVDKDAVDVLFADGEIFKFRKPRVETNHTHGTGCALSAAITAGLALGRDLVMAIEDAEKYITLALQSAYSVGAGPGPVNHMAPLERDKK